MQRREPAVGRQYIVPQRFFMSPGSARNIAPSRDGKRLRIKRSFVLRGNLVGQQHAQPCNAGATFALRLQMAGTEGLQEENGSQ